MPCIVTVIVEEAAEVMESQVVSCLTDHCQHLILIGKLILYIGNNVYLIIKIIDR